TYHTDLNELLLAGVYLALRQWSGQSRARVMLETAGRADLFADIDASETLGCFTTTFPLLLHADMAGIAAVIKAVKEQRRSVLHQGIGYGLLRHVLGDETLIAAETNDPPVLLFKYRNDFTQMLKADSAFAVADEFSSHAVGPQRLGKHALCLSGSIAAGALRFQLDYSERQ